MTPIFISLTKQHTNLNKIFFTFQRTYEAIVKSELLKIVCYI